MALPNELLGVSVLYLGALNYFFPAQEQLAIVSRIGTIVGQLHVSIAPYVASALVVQKRTHLSCTYGDRQAGCPLYWLLVP